MDQAYDKAGAGETIPSKPSYITRMEYTELLTGVEYTGIALEGISHERLQDASVEVHLSELKLSDGWQSEYQPVHCGTPKAWRLTVPVAENEEEHTSDDEHKEEIVITIQGILADKDLPPFESKFNEKSPTAQRLKQRVTLVGLGSMTFQRAIENIVVLHTHMGRYAGAEKLDKCGALGTVNSMQSIEASNRYFTPKIQAKDCMKGVPFASGVDPKGWLAKAGGKDLLHLEDNVVRFYERVKGREGGEWNFVETEPVKFQVGDIVEIQVSIVAVPQCDHKLKSMLILRAVTLLDGSFTQEADRIRIHDKHTSLVQQAKPVTLKRRVGYGREVHNPSRKIVKLVLEDDAASHRKDDDSEMNVEEDTD
ncbi:hypothetical protein CPB84DRAFT_1846289 [Gymnopilus junonius]|uniref:Uncharacterized protein n=1 Tax=Gymnopilus junonius TaxID=109634 RepID=A0A9P5NSG9_GYMJU|nr:hypothetical protein CPB84DRAFT_1846289 [Gymnopilus junonius]